MKIPFEKWHACRNDFLVFWLADNDGDLIFDILCRHAKRLCAKDGSGIGGDGILALRRQSISHSEPRELQIINSDGSIAKNCGNGLRCASASIYLRNSEKELFSLKVHDLSFNCQIIDSHESQFFVSVEMPQVKIDVALSDFKSIEQNVLRICTEQKMELLLKKFHICEIGNKHLVFFVEKFSDFVRDHAANIAQKLQTISDGINVHFVGEKPISPRDLKRSHNEIEFEIQELSEVWTWERGVGRTPSCGSGACSIGACMFLSEFLSADDWVGLDTDGGRLYVSKTSIQTLRLSGPSVLVFNGEIEL